MIMNTQQLQYLIEIERTRSISHAASNLGIGQPNLSRLLRDTEASIGFPIFERTRTGVRPTEKGVQFLAHARNMLREMYYMEQLGPNSSDANQFRICLPRSHVFLDMVSQYLSGLENQAELDVMIRECHPRQALEMISGGQAEIALIRYGVEYQDYFLEQAFHQKLSMRTLSQTAYQVVFHQDSDLAKLESLSEKDLQGCTELLHRDTFYPGNRKQEYQSRIYTVDRLAQIQLLQSFPNSYIWMEPLPEEMLRANRLIQRPCTDRTLLYQNTLVFKPQRAMSDIERDFVRLMESKYSSKKSK